MQQSCGAVRQALREGGCHLRARCQRSLQLVCLGLVLRRLQVQKHGQRALLGLRDLVGGKTHSTHPRGGRSRDSDSRTIHAAQCEPAPEFCPNIRRYAALAYAMLPLASAIHRLSSRASSALSSRAVVCCDCCWLLGCAMPAARTQRTAIPALAVVEQRYLTLSPHARRLLGILSPGVCSLHDSCVRLNQQQACLGQSLGHGERDGAEGLSGAM